MSFFFLYFFTVIKDIKTSQRPFESFYRPTKRFLYSFLSVLEWRVKKRVPLSGGAFPYIKPLSDNAPNGVLAFAALNYLRPLIMNRIFVTSLLSFQWLPTDLLHFYIHAFFLFKINFIYKRLPCNQKHMAFFSKLSKQCKVLLGN